MEIFLVVLGRAALGFATLLFVTRMVGNKQLGQLNIFTYISGIAIGAMAGAMVIYHDIEIIEAFLGLLIWGTFTVSFEYFSIKSNLFHEITTGHPILVIADGKILPDALRKERLHLEDLMMMLRSNNAFSVDEVAYAVLEVNGELSVFKKADKETPTRADLNLSIKTPMPVQVISDGRILIEQLHRSGHDETWLRNELAGQNIASPKAVFYAELLDDDRLFIQTKF